MKWQECFTQYNYEAMISTNSVDSTRTLGIEFFLESGKVPDELREVYLSERKDELYLVLQPDPKVNIEYFCEFWDSSIMAFINFGKLPGYDHNSIKKLRYNITQILLHGEKKDDKAGGRPLMECPASLAEEKSTSVSRKIFLKCKADDEFDEESRLLLPFWYDELEERELDLKDEEAIKGFLPKEERLSFIFKEKRKLDRREKEILSDQLNFTDEEFDAVKGWLEQWQQ